MHTVIASLPIVCYAVALVLGFLGINLPFASVELSPLIQWMLFLALGLLSLWSAFSHAIYTDRVGWAPSPFQYEIAGANLGIGLGAITDLLVGHPHPPHASHYAAAARGLTSSWRDCHPQCPPLAHSRHPSYR